jgi:anti-sigma regulatory factor (Ser/Thr protein kinase)
MEHLLQTRMQASPAALGQLRAAAVSTFDALSSNGGLWGSADVALAVNEACSNVVTHAYGTQRAGTIELTAWREDDLLVFSITDHGVGIPPGSVTSQAGRGLRLMERLAEMQIVQRASGGIEVRLAFHLGT